MSHYVTMGMGIVLGGMITLTLLEMLPSLIRGICWIIEMTIKMIITLLGALVFGASFFILMFPYLALDTIYKILPNSKFKNFIKNLMANIKLLDKKITSLFDFCDKWWDDGYNKN